ncbi:hypothetical protein C8J56DRAFT_1060486 [Mycena floridula]|nr:hypothetical protein C8J56DRAFT_1060486 [Mycena floridula]
MSNLLSVVFQPITNNYNAGHAALALDDPTSSRAIIESLTRARALYLAVLCVLFSFHAQATRYIDMMFVSTGMLIILIIGFLHDGLDHKSLKHRVGSTGLIGFTVINSMPWLVTAALVLRTVTVVSPSVAVTIIQLVVAFIPVLIQVLCEIMNMRRMSRQQEITAESGTPDLEQKSPVRDTSREE